MNLPLFISMLFLMQLVYYLIGKRASKNVKENKDYHLAGKSVKLLPLTMTFVATQVGGGVVLGSCDEAFKFGWSILLFPMGSALGLMALGLGIGKKLASFPVSTVAELFETLYKSKLLKKLASILSITSLFMILIGQIVASNKFLLSLGVNQPILFALFWAVVIYYTTKGGLKAVISTDLIQSIFFTCIFIISFALIYFSEPAVKSLPSLDLSSVFLQSSKWTSWLLMPLLFMVIEQDMAQRCFAGSSSKAVSKASFLAGLVTLVICMIPVFFGFLASHMGFEIAPNASVLMTLITKLSHPFVASLVGCAVLAAVVSTAQSLISAISSNISEDFEFSKLKNGLKTSQIITFIVAVSALIFAYYAKSVVGILVLSYELSVAALFVPVVFALFKKKHHKLSALLSISLGASSFFIFNQIVISFPKEILSLGVSCMGYFIGEVISLISTSKLKAA